MKKSIWIVISAILLIASSVYLFIPLFSPKETISNQNQVGGVPTGVSNQDGMLELEESGQYKLTVEIRESSQQQSPLPDIRVWSISQGQNILVIAVDENGEYAPIAREYSFSELSNLSSAGSFRLARPREQVAELGVILLMVKMFSIYENIYQWVDFVKDFPDIDKWDSSSMELCINPEQKEKGSQALIGTSLLLMSPSEAFSASGQYIAALGTVVDKIFHDGLNEGVAKLIREQPRAIERWRILTVAETVPYFASFEGFCLEPLDNQDKNSIIEWIKFGLKEKNAWVLRSLSENGSVKVLEPIPFDPEGKLSGEELILTGRSFDEFIIASLTDETSCIAHADSISAEISEQWGYPVSWGVMTRPWTNLPWVDVDGLIFNFEYDKDSKQYNLNRLWLGAFMGPNGFENLGEPVWAYYYNIGNCQ